MRHAFTPEGKPVPSELGFSKGRWFGPEGHMLSHGFPPAAFFDANGKPLPIGFPELPYYPLQFLDWEDLASPKGIPCQ